MKRPGFSPDAEASVAAAKQDNSLFVKIANGETVTVRILPPDREDQVMFTPSQNHWNLRHPDDDTNIAVACLDMHGNEETGYECTVCALRNAVFELPDAERKVYKKFLEDTRLNGRYNMQVITPTLRNGEKVYVGPRLWGVSKKVITTLTTMQKSLMATNKPSFADADKGQDLIVSRTGDGFDTEYTIMLSGDMTSLDDIMPTWADKFWPSLYPKLKLRIYAPDKLRAVLAHTYGKEILELL